MQGTDKSKPFNCEATRDGCFLDENGGRDIRSALHCGYLEQDEWTGDKPSFDKNWIGDPRHPSRRVEIGHLSVCPGWLVRQPAVSDAAQSYAALEKGVLVNYFPSNEHVVLESAMLLARAFNLHQEYVYSSKSDK